MAIVRGTLCRDPLNNGGLLIFFPNKKIRSRYYWNRRGQWNRPTLEWRTSDGKEVKEWHDYIGSCNQCLQWSVSQFLRKYDVNFDLPKLSRCIRGVEIDIDGRDKRWYGWNKHSTKVVTLVEGIDY